MKIAGIIPARYASTRFPGKPMVDIGGKTMIRRVYEQVKKSAAINEVIVATDDERIYKHVQSWDGNVVMTDPAHPSGTDRCREAMEKFDADFDYIINIQGDEPFIAPEQISLLAGLLDGNTQLATLIKRIDDPDEIINPNVVKVVRGKEYALYFSRAGIPFFRGMTGNEWNKHHVYFRHIGIYAYRTDVLKEITKLNQGELEKAESLEQLRWLENGYRIKLAETDHNTIGIDTPEDLAKALKLFS